MSSSTPPSRRDGPTAASPSPVETIRAALQGAMVGAWGRENALRALAELEAEIERLREQVNSGRSYRETQEGLPEGTLPRV